MLFQDRVYIVTGAGSGIGEAAAKRLATDGARVVIADMNEEGGRRVESDIAGLGGTAVFTKVNVAEETEVDRLVDFTVATYGRLDGAINNAGVGQPQGRLHETDVDAWDRLHAVNLRGVFLCLRAEVRYMLSHGGGAIVNTASLGGLTPVPGRGAYVAAKHGVVGLTKQAAMEYIKDGIRVNAVAPGLVATSLFNALTPEQQVAYAVGQPGGRAAQPDEIANAMAWLLSDQASFVSGDVVLVDGAAILH